MHIPGCCGKSPLEVNRRRPRIVCPSIICGRKVNAGCIDMEANTTIDIAVVINAICMAVIEVGAPSKVVAVECIWC